MNSEALLQMVDLLHAQKNIPHEVIFRALEESMAAAVRKRFGEGEDLVCTIDRETGEVMYGEVPPYSVVVAGSMPSKNGINLYCAVIVKRVDERTRSKTGINDLLRD